ncbi:MAG: ATPase, partial [Thermosphaera sp.]
KTIESPRDMILPPNITQYSKNYADLGELHDILLLSRPDYTVFDEMRYDEDFKLFADLRLAGIGMIGVVHATSPIDAIQRFIGRVELGMIPSIIDTVIFIRKGIVDKVYDVRMTVKLPTGLKEAELSRPVIEVRDFLTGELEYEIYTFGEQTVVVPVKKLRGKPSLLDSIIENVRKILPDAEVSVEDNMIVVAISRSMLKNYNRRVKRLRKLEEKYNIPIKIKIT